MIRVSLRCKVCADLNLHDEDREEDGYRQLWK